jgi:hypothetical protein
VLYVVIIIGFAIVIFQLGALRILAVQNNKFLRMTIKMLEQIDDIDPSFVAQDAQAEIDILGGNYG